MTRPKPTSEVILITEKGDPLLAWWRYGLGMSVAFTSDAKSRWAAEWITWPGFGKFWTQVIRQAMRKSDAQGIAVDLDRDDNQTAISVDAVDALGQFLNESEVELTVVDPQLRAQSSHSTNAPRPVHAHDPHSRQRRVSPRNHRQGQGAAPLPAVARPDGRLQ
jgi:hypothetical protein